MKGSVMIRCGILALACAAFVAHALVYRGWVEDDAFISFRYAQNLLNGHGLVYNVGERVEGYSNPLWVVLVAWAMRLGWDPVGFAQIAGLLAGLACLPLSWRLARRCSGRGEGAALAAPWLLATSPVLARHAVSGLETALFALLLAASVVLAGSSGRVPRALLILCSGLLTLTRPEGAFFAALILLGHSLLRRTEWPSGRWRLKRGLPIEWGVFLAVVAALLAWRWVYYGSFLPNTFYAKMTGDMGGLIDGVQYAADFLRDSGGAIWLLLLLPMLLARRAAGPARLGIVVLAAYAAFMVFAGGDWMLAYRFGAHMLPLAAGLAVAGTIVLWGMCRSADVGRVPLCISVAVLAVGAVCISANSELAMARMVLPSVRSGAYLSQSYARVGRWLRDNSVPEATVAACDIGALGFYSERHIIDMFGLVEPRIARSSGKQHHKASPRYVLECRPEWVVLVESDERCAGRRFRRLPDSALFAQEQFQRNYEVVLRIPIAAEAEEALVFRRIPD